VDDGFAPHCARAAPILSMINDANQLKQVPNRAQEKAARRNKAMTKTSNCKTSEVGHVNGQK
jgi:hypothetical protein